MRFRLVLASLPVLLASTSAPGEPAVELVWLSTTGAGTPGSSSIEADVGDFVTLALNVLADSDGVVQASVDLAFDTGLAPVPGFVEECFAGVFCLWINTQVLWSPFSPGVDEFPNSLESFDAAGSTVSAPDSMELARVEFEVLDVSSALSVDVAYLSASGILNGALDPVFPVASATVVPPPGPPPITSPFQTLVSADVTAEFEGAVGSRTVEDEVAAKGDKITAGVGNQATPERFEIGTLPPGADLKALAVRPTTGEVLFALDVPVALPGVAFAEPRDLLEYDPMSGSYSVELDGAAAGVPAGVAIDAVLLGPAGELFVSFDTSTDAGSSHADDEDLVEVTSATTLGGVLDLSDLGFDPRLDLDAVSAYDETTGDFVTFSFDTAGTIDGVPFEDEDGVTTFDLDDPDRWFVIHDGSERFDAWSRADLDAVHFVPEPGTGLGLLCGAALLAHLHRPSCRSRDRNTTRRRSS